MKSLIGSLLLLLALLITNAYADITAKVCTCEKNKDYYSLKVIMSDLSDVEPTPLPGSVHRSMEDCMTEWCEMLSDSCPIKNKPHKDKTYPSYPKDSSCEALKAKPGHS